MTCRDAQLYMNALADKVHKQELPYHIDSHCYMYVELVLLADQLS